MGHGHTHRRHVSERAGARHVGRLRWAFGLIFGFLVVQVVAAVTTGSLVLLSDAGHMATDVIGIGMALAAISVASAPARSTHRTFGLYRIEILAALANAALLFGMATWVLIEAAGRIGDAPEVSSVPVLVVGMLGLGVNLVAFGLLRAGSRESLNLRGAYEEVLADTVGSVGVIVAATAMLLTGWAWVDPFVGAAIGTFILPRAWRLGRDALRILVQAAPDAIDPIEVADALAALDGVTDVHDVHVWTLTSDMDVVSAHLAVVGADPHDVVDRARVVLAERFRLDHATLQVERPGDDRCRDIGW